MQVSRVCILGGTGFVGRSLIYRLAKQGVRCRVITRHPQRHRDIGLIPGAELRPAGSLDATSLAQQFADCGAVINLVGILNERGSSQTFRRVHVELVERIVDACRETAVKRLLHMSALNADQSQGSSDYLRSKGEGENHAHTLGQSSIHVTSFRPSVIFGRNDSFFNRFAGLLRLSRMVFPLACPESRFSPVYIGDVAEAFARSLNDADCYGRRYDLCGPRTFTLRELVIYTRDQLGLHTHVLGLGDRLSRLQARALGLLPGKPFSYDNYLSLQTDSVCSENGLVALGIAPTDIASIVPGYLGQQSERAHRQRLRGAY